MMANAIPIANAQPIGKRPPKAEAPNGLRPLRVNVAIAAMPGKLWKSSVYWPTAYI
jgi:hypothetical protein